MGTRYTAPDEKAIPTVNLSFSSRSPCLFSDLYSLCSKRLFMQIFRQIWCHGRVKMRTHALARIHTHKQTPRPSKKNNTTSDENMKTHGLCVLALAIVCMFCLESVQTWTDHHGARCPSHRTEWCGDTAAWTVISRHFRDFLQACCCWCRRLGATRGPKRVFVGFFFFVQEDKKKMWILFFWQYKSSAQTPFVTPFDLVFFFLLFMNELVCMNFSLQD